MSIRRLKTLQKTKRLNEIYAIDTKGYNGSNHQYAIVSEDFPNTKNKYYNEEYLVDTVIQFQYGAREEEGSIPGVLDIDLLEIVKDRLLSLNEEFFTTEVTHAIMHIESALIWMNKQAEDK